MNVRWMIFEAILLSFVAPMMPAEAGGVGPVRTLQMPRTVGYGLVIAVVVLLLITSLTIRAMRSRTRAYQREIQSLKALLEHQRLEDTLTGIHNRRFLGEFLAKEIPNVARGVLRGEEPRLLVILIDLDDFKSINDRHGHEIGDEAIRASAEVLRSCARESDVLVRWGGEEFLWLCRDTPAEDGPVLCDRVRDRMRETTIKVGDVSIALTCSVGFAPFPLWGHPEREWDRSLKLAEAALSEAKGAGCDRWRGYIVRPEGTRPTDFEISRLVTEGTLERVSS